jgi:hypothetical protein
MRKTAIHIVSAVLLAACASSSLVPGQSRIDDVKHDFGEPAMVFRDADGTSHLAYPTAPMGYRTLMADIGPDGRLRGIGNVLDAEHFARIAPGMTKEQVLRVLGPPTPERTMYFAARDELAWDWHYCDDWNAGAFFSVLFDATRGTVRSTLSTRETCLDSQCWCAH